MRLKKYLTLLTLLLIGIVFLPNFDRFETVNANGIDDVTKINRDGQYSKVLSDWIDDGYRDDILFNEAITPLEFLNYQDNKVDISNSLGYKSGVYELQSDEILEFNVEVEEAGLYEISMDYFSISDSILPIELNVMINGKTPYREASQITLDSLWRFEKETFDTDRYGNEVLPKQERIKKWMKQTLRDTTRIQDENLKFLLDEGLNTITITLDSGNLLVGDISIHNKKEFLSYDEYFDLAKGNIIKEDYITYQSELFKSTSHPSIRPGTSREAGVKPFDVVYMKVNILDGDTFKKPGHRVDWEIEVPKTGYYQLTFKIKQDFEINSASYQSIYINGEIPFEEAKYIAFPNSARWENVTIADWNQNPYYFYLKKGENTLSLEVNSSLYKDVYEGTQNMMKEINELTLDIKQLTGNNADKNRDWNMHEYIPNLKNTLEEWKDTVDDYYAYLNQLNHSNKESQEMVLFKLASRNLSKLIKDYDELPYKLNVLSEGSGSVSQLLGDSLDYLIEQPLSIDAFYIHADESDLPNSEPNFFVKMWVFIKRFFLSFFISPYDDTVLEDEINVWVNRPRLYVNLMQEMADSSFTKETGIKVKFSVMPDENKLVLANAADAQPDLAMGIHTNLSYQLTLRDAVYDLRQFDDFEQMLDIYQEGALIPFIHDEGVYGLPDTQNFNVLFYRKDILDKLDIPVPNTWDEVISILPELQRYGMNFFVPLAYANSYKTFDTTTPFIYQFEGDLYDENGMKTVLDNDRSIEAISFMTDLFSIYSMPMQVPNFYNHFRYGMLPIGIGDFGVYVQLMYAAPELKGQWDIQVIPGIENEDGEILRYATGPGQGMTIFNKSDKKNAAWQLMKWWMETETQVEFDRTLTTTLGPEYMWNSANIEAFRLSTWPEEDKEVILNQWEWLRNVPNTPATYMVERELSNIWNEVVMSGESVRDAVDDSIIKINREITRKNIEFGYVDKNGNMIEPYNIATLDMIRSWVREDEE